MAEERLIDTDKDKKYRIKINADGEEELVVDGETEGEETVEEVMFDVPEEHSLEDIRGVTPEEIEKIRQKEAQEAEERKAKVKELLEKANAENLLFRFSTALEYVEEAEELDGENGDAQALKLVAYTRNFTDFSQIVPAAESADKLASYTSNEKRAELLATAQPALEGEIAKLRTTVSAMNRENEEKKAERAVRFKRDRNVAFAAFCAMLAVFVTFTALAGHFATLIRTVPTNKYLILTCVFAGCAAVFLLALAFAARFLIIALRRVSLNKRNTATQLGRDLLTEQAKLKAFVAVYSALKGIK